MRNNNISLLEWPPCSPDCNPIENLDALKLKIQQEWDSLNVEEVRKLIESFPKRLVAVVGSQGGNIKNY